MARVSQAVLNRVRQIRVPLSHHGKVLRTYLFGSLVWGQPTPDSDIDVAVFVDGVEKWDPRRRASVIAEVQQAVGDDVELHLFPGASLSNPARAGLARLILDKGVPVD